MLLTAATAALWFAKALFDYFLTSEGDFWRLVAEYPEQALVLLAAEPGCLIDPRSRPSGYLGPFFVLEHRVHLSFEHADAIKARVARKLNESALQQLSPSRAPIPNDPDVLRRSVRFVGWTNADRPGSVSALKWWAGFGWAGVAVFTAALAAVLFTEGAVQAFAAGTASLSLVILTHRCVRWNSCGWPRVHYRAMLIYAELAHHEVRRAEQADRSFDRFAVWRDLAVAISRGQARKEAVEAMILALMSEGDAHFESLLENFDARALPETGAGLQFADRVRAVIVGPQLVVCQIVENTFGPEEAVRYILAVLNNKAP